MLKIKINPRKNFLNEAHHPSFCSENSHSNGFITPSGEYIPSKGKFHRELAFDLAEQYEDIKNLIINANHVPLDERIIEIGWIRVTNAFTYDVSRSRLNSKQIETIINLIYFCQNAGSKRLRILDVDEPGNSPYVNIKALEVTPKILKIGKDDDGLFESLGKKIGMKKKIKESLVSSENIGKFCDPKQICFGFIYPNGNWDNGYEGMDVHVEIAARIISDNTEKYSQIIKTLGFEHLDEHKLWEKLKETNKGYVLLVQEEGFVKVSNAFTYMINPHRLSPAQRQKIIELVLSCQNAPENRLRIYDVRTNSLYVDIKASEISEKILARGSISKDLYESIGKKFKKFLSK